MKRQQTILILAIAVVLLTAVTLVITTRGRDYQVANAVLVVSSGNVTLTGASGAQNTIVEGGRSAVANGDSLTVSGRAVLSLAGAQIQLENGLHLTLTEFKVNDTEGQITLTLSAGQATVQMVGYNDPRSQLSIKTPTSSLKAKTGEFSVWVSDKGVATQIGVFSGQVEAALTDGTWSGTLHEGDGVTLRSGQAPNPGAWSKTRILVYRPNGDSVARPVSLTNSESGDTYTVLSDRVNLLPPGTYSLKIDLFIPYQLAGITLTNDKLNEVSVTLAEIMLSAVKGDQTPAGAGKLIVRVGDAPDTSSLTPGDWVLASPGTWSLTAARVESPQAGQTFRVDLAPGQRWSATLQDNLFGAGSLQVNVVAPKEANIGAVDVWVYHPGEENFEPFLKFRADGSAQSLAQGRYIVSVRTKIAARYDITIGISETKAITVFVGGLLINYVDGQGKPLTRDLYVASAGEMKRLDIVIKRMNQTPYGVTIKTNVKLWVPAGTYSLLVDDATDVTRDSVTVQSAETTKVELAAAQ